MTEAESRKLRAFSAAMVGLERTLASMNTSGAITDASTYDMIASEVAAVEEAFPTLLPSFSRETFFAHDVGRGAHYKLDGLRLYVTRAVGRLRTAAEQAESNPVTQSREFAHVEDSKLRAIVVRDYNEAQRAFIAKCWKSVIVLCGGLIEAILLDLLQGSISRALSAKESPKERDLTRWTLSQLIGTAVALDLVSHNVEKLSHPVREYRNLIHPGVELRSSFEFGAEEATIALEVLHILDRDRS